jgi:IS605 OrfB family transposase
MHGFAKTRMFNLLVSQGVAAQFDQTVEQYRQVVSFYLNVFQEHQEILGNGEWLKITEHLTHTTRRNPLPRYDFDLQFPNYPSGMRRAAISEAYGSACSWGSSYLKWQTEKEKHEIKNRQRELAGKHPILFVKHPPQYPSDCRSWPSFYGTECKILDDHHVKVKLFIGGDYTYRKVALLESLTVPEGYLSGSPTLVHKAWGWELHFPIGLQKRLNLIKIDEQFFLPGFLFCSVDLGINNHAVLTIQDAKGRVYATKFISGGKDIHLRKRLLEKIVRLQKQTKSIPEGERFAKDLWDKISNFNNDIAHQVSRQIVNFAKEHGATVIVFEHLTNLKPEKGAKSHWLNRKLGYWLKARIFEYNQYKALHASILTSRVNPKYTSARCPYCGYLTIKRYTPSHKRGVKLARCTNCRTHGVNSDFVGSMGIGAKFRLRYAA